MAGLLVFLGALGGVFVAGMMYDFAPVQAQRYVSAGVVGVGWFALCFAGAWWFEHR